MKRSTEFLPIFLLFALAPPRSTANQTDHVVEYTDLETTTCWKNELFRSDALPSNGSEGLVVINDFLVGIMENFRESMRTGIPHLKVPVLDPFRLPRPIKINVKEEMTTVHGNFSNLEVKGLSNFRIDHLNTNLHNLSFTFSLRLPQIYASGHYILDGVIVRIFPLKGNGTFWIKSRNLTLSAASSIESTMEGYLQLAKDFDVCIDFEEVRMDFENLLGGGKWTEILKKILNDMGKNLFAKSLPFVKGELKKALLKVINKHLMKMPIKSLIPGSTANQYVDQILSDVRQNILGRNYDPIKLPDYNYAAFSKKFLSTRVHGEAKLFDGWLSGLSSIHRTGECTLNSSFETIALSGHLGLTDLSISYKGHAKFMHFGPVIECGGRISQVSFFVGVEQSNIPGATPYLRDLKILRISTIYVEISGLGPITWMFKWLFTGISKVFKSVIVNKVTEYLREFLEEEFQKASFLK